MGEAPVRRTYQVYLYAVCFVAIIVFLIGAASGLFGLVRIAFPDQTAQDIPSTFVSEEELSVFTPVEGATDPERRRGVVQFLENGILAGLAAGVFVYHWRQAGRIREDLEGRPPPEQTA